jgi:hypothetical protein
LVWCQSEFYLLLYFCLTLLKTYTLHTHTAWFTPLHLVMIQLKYCWKWSWPSILTRREIWQKCAWLIPIREKVTSIIYLWYTCLFVLSTCIKLLHFDPWPDVHDTMSFISFPFSFISLFCPFVYRKLNHHHWSFYGVPVTSLPIFYLFMYDRLYYEYRYCTNLILTLKCNIWFLLHIHSTFVYFSSWYTAVIKSCFILLFLFFNGVHLYIVMLRTSSHFNMMYSLWYTTTFKCYSFLFCVCFSIGYICISDT